MWLGYTVEDVPRAILLFGGLARPSASTTITALRMEMTYGTGLQIELT
jgi:hypothetical protein